MKQVVVVYFQRLSGKDLGRCSIARYEIWYYICTRMSMVFEKIRFVICCLLGNHFSIFVKFLDVR